jgi:Fe-S-cluster containining protein
MNLREKYNRTVCACPSCQACCLCKPGMLAPGDLELIASHLGKNLIEILDCFQASEGALVIMRGKATRIPTIVPNLIPGIGCVFLDDRRMCIIHGVAPYGCGWFDIHMDEVEGSDRSRDALVEIVKDIQVNGSYITTWLELKAAEAVATPLAERQGNLDRMIEEIESQTFTGKDT